MIAEGIVFVAETAGSGRLAVYCLAFELVPSYNVFAAWVFVDVVADVVLVVSAGLGVAGDFRVVEDDVVLAVADYAFVAAAVGAFAAVIVVVVLTFAVEAVGTLAAAHFASYAFFSG